MKRIDWVVGGRIVAGASKLAGESEWAVNLGGEDWTTAASEDEAVWMLWTVSPMGHANRTW